MKPAGQGSYGVVPATAAEEGPSTDFVSLELDEGLMTKTSEKARRKGQEQGERQGLIKAAGHTSSSPAPAGGNHAHDTHALSAALNAPPIQGAEFTEKQLGDYDHMINWMIYTYLMCLGLGWGLLLFDYLFNVVEKHPKSEPWINDAVIIGGASAVLSPIIQWGHTILHSKPEVSAVAARRYKFFCCMWLVYVTIVGTSTLVAVIRFAMGEDGTLHHFIATTSNHLVLARISASMISWVSGKLFIKWYRDRLSAGPMF